MSNMYLFMLPIRHDRRNMLQIQRRNLRDSTDPFSIPELRFVELFRFSKTAAKDLVAELSPFMKTGARSTFIPNHLRVCAALHFYATGSFLCDIGQDFVCPISKTMRSRIIHDVTLLIQNNLMKNYIIFPTSTEDQQLIKHRFVTSTGFPGVLGAIDFTHVKIKKLTTDVEYCYINRKGYFSKNIQLICDFDLRILGCYTRFGGSTHDAFIWESSQIKAYLHRQYNQDRCFGGWLIGDSGYPLQPWLMTPYRTTENVNQEQYNKEHIQARNCVELLNGVLKKVFGCLSADRVLMLSPVFAGAIINACCTLHNIRLRYNLSIPQTTNYISTGQTDESFISNTLLNEGRTIRDSITRNYF